MFREWLSGTEPLPHTPGALRPSSFVFVVFCVHVYSFAGLIKWMPPPMFSDTAITDRHSDTTFFPAQSSLGGYPGLLDPKNHSDMCPRWELNPRLPACKASSLSTRFSTVSVFAQNMLEYIAYC